ncbi:MAG: hypothetical protein IT257_07760 [Chitinophagaceae bacterium]|nr:hypothetical protein [Chitinophagaceae bacterium]
MMNKHFAFKAVLFAVAGVAALLLCFLFRIKNDPAHDTTKSIQPGNAGFDQQCYTAMKKDTFVQLLTIAYGSAINLQEHADELQIKYTGSDQSLPDFYNGNEILLKTDAVDAGFKITRSEGALDLAFKLNGEAVNVPNDILIKLLPKYKLKLPKKNN